MFLEMYFETNNDKYIFFDHIILMHKPVNVLIFFLFLFFNVVFDTYRYYCRFKIRDVNFYNI